ncbi:MAG: efflux RND transporter permease subunit [Spirochaetales bacterium]|nr:efflux RND transporter permease subunit [Leptospiraceae bacterium]MCP5479912.1 efflux RND transporter permease subunit [Spirochaetales bacterium]MCP5486653.1 efflux RND transporter permease subunit [Spirochaetales bacterium]
MATAALVLLGIAGLSRLPVALRPGVTESGATIITRYPGVSAARIEQQLTIPVERAVSDLGSIESIVSRSADGESRVNLIFSDSAADRFLLHEISERLESIRHLFPREVEEPVVVQYDPSNRPGFVVAFRSDFQDAIALREYVEERVKPAFERINGVSEVFVGGGAEREIQVLLDAPLLPGHLLSGQEVAAAIAHGGPEAPIGRVQNRTETEVQVTNRFDDAAAIAAAAITSTRGISSVATVARVQHGHREPETIAHRNGEDRISLYVSRAGGAGALEFSARCATALRGLDLPPGLFHETTFDEGQFIRDAIEGAVLAAAYGGLTAIVVLHLFLGRWKSTILTALMLPLSILGTFFLMFVTGTGIDVMSLSGLALGSGMLIDAGVVVCESIEREWKRAIDPVAAAVGATARVLPELIAATLTTLIVFSPLVLSRRDLREQYAGLCLTLSFALILSLILSLVVLPAFKLAVDSPHAPAAPRSRISRRERVLRVLQSVQRRLLFVCLRWPKLTAAATLLFMFGPLGFFLMELESRALLDSSEIQATIDLPTGTHLDRTAQLVEGIAATVGRQQGVAAVSARIEKWHGTLYIEPAGPYRSPSGVHRLVERLRGAVSADPEVFVHFESDAGGQGGLTLHFLGNDELGLRTLAGRVATELQSGVPGIDQIVYHFREPRQELVIHPRSTLLARAGLSVGDLAGMLRQLVAGSVVAHLYEGGREVDIRVRAFPEQVKSPADLQKIRFALGDRVHPLVSLASLSNGESPAQLWRRDRRPSVSIGIHSHDRTLDSLAVDVESRLKAFSFPADYTWRWDRMFESARAARGDLLAGVVFAILAVYLLLAALMESLTRPFLILLTIPMSAGGVCPALAVAGYPLGMSAILGLLILCGIVVNGSILLQASVDEKIGSRGAGSLDPTAALRAVARACRVRLRPILMTGFTTLAGVLPMLFAGGSGSELWRPLAVSVFFGLLFSVPVTLLLIPNATLALLTINHRRLTIGR